MMRRVIRENTGRMQPGQDLIIAGPIGQVGTTLIVREKKTELLTWFAEEYLDQILNENEIVLDENSELWKKFSTTECEPVQEGGVLAALWNLSGAYGMGIEFTLRRIPIKQSVIEICERYELNPYRLLSGNCLLLASDHGAQLVRDLEREGIDVAVIGKVTRGIKRIIDHGGSIGYLDRPSPDEVYKMIPDLNPDQIK